MHNLHPGANKLAPPREWEQICTRVQICTRCKFLKHRSHGQKKTPWVQICTLCANLHPGEIAHTNEALDSVQRSFFNVYQCKIRKHFIYTTFNHNPPYLKFGLISIAFIHRTRLCNMFSTILDSQLDFTKFYSYSYGGTYIHALLVSSKSLLKAVNSFNFFSNFFLYHKI